MYPVSLLCSALGVSRSWFYGRKKAPESAHALRDQALKVLIRKTFEESRGAYGSPRIHADLKAKGEKTSPKRVARLMQEEGLVAKKRRRTRRTTDSSGTSAVAPDLVRRDFSSAKPNRVWVSDISYVRTREGFLYLCIFLDLYSRRVVGWSLDRTMDTEYLVLKAFHYSVSDRKPRPGLIVHSDRGSQYASTIFREALAGQNCLQSMGRRGDCLDNAVAESFFDSYKTETGVNESVLSEVEVRRRTFQYIEGFYNRRRRHSTLGYKSPFEFEQEENQVLDSEALKVA